MFCRNCGHQLADGDKFCSVCGAKTEVAENNAAVAEGISQPAPAQAAPAEDKPLFEPFDFSAFGFDFSDLGMGTGAKKEETAEEAKPAPPTEKFDWNTDVFPDRNTTTKTEDINFNWSLSPEEVEKAPEPEIFTAPEQEWTAPEPEKEAESTKSLEDELFGDIGSKADETRKQSEEIDKFFTWTEQNARFQAILDREYEKVKSGNIITEEMNAAEAVSEEKFTARQPEDPMEALFEAEGIIRGYEPKPVETDVLDRIEAEDAEKRIREEAARLAAEEKARLEAEAAAAQQEEEQAAEIEEVIETAETPVEEPVEEVAAEEPAVEEVQVEEVAEPAVEEIQAEEVAEEPVADLEELIAEPVQEDVPEKTKQVDKAAILAGVALAEEMVERDKAFAAAKEAEAAAAAAAEAAAMEEIKMGIPDFLGHTEEPAVEEIQVEETTEEPAEEPVAEEVPAEEPVIEVAEVIEAAAEEEQPVELTIEEAIANLTAEAEEEEPAEEAAPDFEFDIFEQLEELESPAEEIVLTEPQTIEDLFAETETAEEVEETVTEHTVVLTEDSVAEILKTVEADTTKDDTMAFTAHALGAILAEAEVNDPDAKEVVVSLEDLTSLEQQAAEGTLPGIAAAEEEEEEEEIKGGKGRTFLKICLVILILLLVIEVAGVAIKIAAPTSGAANFIDNQLEKVFQLIGDEDTDPAVLSADNDLEA